MPTTANRAIRYPQGTNQPDVPLDFSNMASDLDNVASAYFGTLAARGAVSAGAGTAKGKAGTFYIATDTGQVFVSTGTVWIDLGAGPPIPIGASLEYAGAGDPTDNRFLLEDGRSLNSVTDTTLASLFATIGTTYGGTGASAFNLPDSRGRVTIGPDNMSTAASAANRLPNNPSGRGNVGGEERHTISLAELPALGVDVANPLATGTGKYVLSAVDKSGSNWRIGPGGDGNASPIGGSGTPHNNLQPYVVKNKIIRVR